LSPPDSRLFLAHITCLFLLTRSEIPVLSLSALPITTLDVMGLVPETKVRILEELSENPAHGYLLAKNLDLSHGYIYTHLKELREEGMIEIVEDREGKKVYGLTQDGEYLLKALSD
jgi:DNA-binding transcriptional ArsR family regulator